MEIYEAIKKTRKGKQCTQEQIASILMTTQQQYSKYEKGKQEIPARHIKKLSEYYNVPADMLLGKETYYSEEEAKNNYLKLFSQVEDLIYWARYQGHITEDAKLVLLSNLYDIKEDIDKENIPGN